MEHADQETLTRARRMATQRLESLQRAGVTALPRTKGSNAESVAAPAADGSNAGNSDNPAAVLSPAAATGGLFTTDGEKPPVRPCQSLAERQAELATVRERVAACVRCRELAETRTQTVFGVGNPEAKLLFIGEAPGADEDRQGEPFVGKAGQLLNRIIIASKLKREDLYICNILKCRPPGNRTPTGGESANCREYLDAQIAAVDPDYIVCWGTVAAQNLLSRTEPIGKLRGRFFTHGRAKVLCTYHPSYLLRTESAKKDVWQDMKFLMRDMGIVLD
jgi:DNA polymerase